MNLHIKSLPDMAQTWTILAIMLLAPAITANAEVSSISDANVYCPVTTDEKVDPPISTTHDGREIYFCCKRCKRKFERNPQAYLDNLPTGYFAAASLDQSQTITVTDDHNDAGEHEHGHDAEGAAPGVSGGDVSGASGGGGEASGASGGDHAAHGSGESRSFLMHLIGWFGNFHPPSVNFPVALIMAALVAEGLFMATGRPLFDAASRFSVWFAILGTVGAVTLGWFFAGFKLTDGDWLMTTHRWVGTAAGVWSLVLAWFAVKAWTQTPDAPNRWRGRYRIALLIAVTLIHANGFFGGAMIYGLDHYAW